MRLHLPELGGEGAGVRLYTEEQRFTWGLEGVGRLWPAGEDTLGKGTKVQRCQQVGYTFRAL